MIDKWRLGGKISGVTSDTTNVNPAAFQEITGKWMGCYAHVLHLAVTDSLKLAPTALTEIKKIRAVFKILRSSMFVRII